MFGGILIGFLILSSIEIKGGKDPHYNPFPSSIRQKKKKIKKIRTKVLRGVGLALML
jgi:hypothetical protein